MCPGSGHERACDPRLGKQPSVNDQLSEALSE